VHDAASRREHTKSLDSIAWYSAELVLHIAAGLSRTASRDRPRIEEEYLGNAFDGGGGKPGVSANWPWSRRISSGWTPTAGSRRGP